MNATLKLSLAIACCWLVGCGAKENIVSGSVTYNGQPVENGSISFQPEGGKGAGFGAMVVNGKYKADKVYPGKKIALVRGVNANDSPHSRDEYERRAAEARAAGQAQPMAGPAEYIPENASGNASAVEITGGQQTIDFTLTGPPRK